MVAQTTLQLVRPEQTDVIPFERRADHRHVVTGRATVLQTHIGPHRERRNRIGSLMLMNMSDHGLGAIAQEPIEPGTCIVVFFPPHGPERGFDLYGRVVRCQPCEQGGHRVGVRFNADQTAA